MKQHPVLKLASAAMLALASGAFAAMAGQTSHPEPAPEPGAYAETENPLNAVVKLEVTTAKPDICCPWANRTGGGTGSGVVIAAGRILTCAHCVTDASYIRVRKHNEDMLYHASVLFIDNDADLALVGVEDPAFMNGITPMEIGETPHVQDDVLAVGYPRGGEDISFTRGIVSRIEDIVYSHSWTSLLGVQVDAAINPGNSGGPVLDLKTGKIAGIAFQGLGKSEGESLGYIIPPDIIRHFLEDVKDGKVDGFSDILFSRGNMESPAKRRCCKMGRDLSGVIVESVDAVLGDDSIRTDDIILEIDGYKVSNNGRIRLKGGEPRSLYYPIYMRQIGEKVPVKVYRDGTVVETSIAAAKRNPLARKWMYDTKPDYFVYGGFVFTTVSYDYIVTTEAKFHDNVISKAKEFPGNEAVVISFCFADTCIEGYIGCNESLVRSVNGVKVRNLRHLVEIVDAQKDGFVRFGLDRGKEWDAKVIVDAKEMREATKRVMKRNLIPHDRSEDLRSKSAGRKNGKGGKKKR